LATDLSHHLEFVGRFKRQAPGSTKAAMETDGGPLGKGFDPSVRSDKLMVLQMTLKAADIGHSIKKLPLHLEWSRRITEEFFLQGDRERALGIPIGPFNDRMHTNVAKSQIGFLDFVVSPCYTVWAEYMGNIQETIHNLSVNRSHWLGEVDKPKLPVAVDTSLSSPATRSRTPSEAKDDPKHQSPNAANATSSTLPSTSPAASSSSSLRPASRPSSAERRAPVNVSSNRSGNVSTSITRVGSPLHMAITVQGPDDNAPHTVRGSPPTLTASSSSTGIPLSTVSVNMGPPATSSLASPKGLSSRAVMGGSSGSLKKVPSNPGLGHHDSNDSNAPTPIPSVPQSPTASAPNSPPSHIPSGRLLAAAVADTTSSSSSPSHNNGDLARVNEGDEDIVSPHRMSLPIAIQVPGKRSSVVSQISLSGLVVDNAPLDHR
jgi:hypothetical protein